MISFLREFTRTLRMPCRDTTALFSRQLDAPLAPGMAAGLRVHTIYCAGCRRYRKQIHRLRQLAGRIGAETEAGEKMPGEVRARLLRNAQADLKKNP